MKTCAKCGVDKPLSEFSPQGKYICRYCKPCNVIKAGEWKKANPEKNRATARKWKKNNPEKVLSIRYKSDYGITLADFDTILASQSGVCAICGSGTPGGKGRFHVDHDHATGTVRGLLCHKCNTGLGLFNDSPTQLANAISYLEKHDG